MRKAEFSGAMLLGANFGPKVFGLKFRDAQAVTGTSFALLPAIAIETDFRGATLHNATFEECPLEGADFREASLGGTRFLDVSLATAKGLDSCFHASPSYLDYRTLLRSGKLPTSFLRGCALPDTLIEYLPSLIGEPLQFYSCFISHSSKDAEFVRRVYADLQNRDIRCWFAPEDLRIGDKFRVRIEESIRVHDKLLVVLSENSIRSAWVEEEVEAGLERERRENSQVIFPIRLDDSVMETEQAWAASLRRQRHIGAFSRWQDHKSYLEPLDRLVLDRNPATRSPIIKPKSKDSE